MTSGAAPLGITTQKGSLVFNEYPSILKDDIEGPTFSSKHGDVYSIFSTTNFGSYETAHGTRKAKIAVLILRKNDFQETSSKEADEKKIAPGAVVPKPVVRAMSSRQLSSASAVGSFVFFNIVNGKEKFIIGNPEHFPKADEYAILLSRHSQEDRNHYYKTPTEDAVILCGKDIPLLKRTDKSPSAKVIQTDPLDTLADQGLLQLPNVPSVTVSPLSGSHDASARVAEPVSPLTLPFGSPAAFSKAVAANSLGSPRGHSGGPANPAVDSSSPAKASKPQNPEKTVQNPRTIQDKCKCVVL